MLHKTVRGCAIVDANGVMEQRGQQIFTPRVLPPDSLPLKRLAKENPFLFSKLLVPESILSMPSRTPSMLSGRATSSEVAPTTATTRFRKTHGTSESQMGRLQLFTNFDQVSRANGKATNPLRVDSLAPKETNTSTATTNTRISSNLAESAEPHPQSSSHKRKLPDEMPPPAPATSPPAKRQRTETPAPPSAATTTTTSTASTSPSTTRRSPSRSPTLSHRSPKRSPSASKSDALISIFPLNDIGVDLSASTAFSFFQSTWRNFERLSIGVITRTGKTNFRDTRRSLKRRQSNGGDSDGAPVRPAAVGIGIFLIGGTAEQRAYYMPLAEPPQASPTSGSRPVGANEVPHAARWALVCDIFNSLHHTKICFELQAVLVALLRAGRQFLTHRADEAQPDEEPGGSPSLAPPNGMSACRQPTTEKRLLFRPTNLMDPKIAAWVHHPELASYEFSSLMKRYVSGDVDSGHGDNMSAGEFSEESQASDVAVGTGSGSPLESFWDDVTVAAQLMGALSDALQADALLAAFTEQEMPLVPRLAEMELEGVGVDVDMLVAYREVLQKRLDVISAEAARVLGHSLNLASPAQVANALFSELRLPKSPQAAKNGNGGGNGGTSPNGHASTSESVLLGLKHLHPLPDLVLQFRHVHKLLTTYTDALINKAVPEEGSEPHSTGVMRLHTRWLQTNTATGRLASVNPNMQQLPREPLRLSDSLNQTLAINIRDAVVARPSCTLLAADYSQLEMRLLAHCSKDSKLLEFFRQKRDVHTLIAAHWLGKSPDDVKPEERDRAKRISYGIVYGCGPEFLSEALGVSLEEARSFRTAFLAKFPKIKNFLDDAVVRARRATAATTLCGRRRPLPDIHSRDREKRAAAERQAVNTVIQGTAADLVKRAMLDFHSEAQRMALRARLLMQIHDELVYEVPAEELYATARLLKQCMEGAASGSDSALVLDVPLPVVLSFGSRFGSLNKLDDSVLDSNMTDENGEEGARDVFEGVNEELGQARSTMITEERELKHQFVYTEDIASNSAVDNEIEDIDELLKMADEVV